MCVLMSSSPPTLLLHCIILQCNCKKYPWTLWPAVLQLCCCIVSYFNAISKNVYEPYGQQSSNFVALYLNSYLNAISKNVYEPYGQQSSNFVVALYHTLMQSQKMSMNLMASSSPTLLLRCIWIHTSMQSQKMSMNLMASSSPTLSLHCNCIHTHKFSIYNKIIFNSQASIQNHLSTPQPFNQPLNPFKPTSF